MYSNAGGGDDILSPLTAARDIRSSEVAALLVRAYICVYVYMSTRVRACLSIDRSIADHRSTYSHPRFLNRFDDDDDEDRRAWCWRSIPSW